MGDDPSSVRLNTSSTFAGCGQLVAACWPYSPHPWNVSWSGSFEEPAPHLSPMRENRGYVNSSEKRPMGSEVSRFPPRFWVFFVLTYLAVGEAHPTPLHRPLAFNLCKRRWQAVWQA